MKIKVVPAILAALAAATLLTWASRPDKAPAVLSVSKDYLFEIKFLGTEFALLRLALTVPAVLIISALMSSFRLDTSRIQ